MPTLSLYGTVYRTAYCTLYRVQCTQYEIRGYFVSFRHINYSHIYNIGMGAQKKQGFWRVFWEKLRKMPGKRFTPLAPRLA